MHWRTKACGCADVHLNAGNASQARRKQSLHTPADTPVLSTNGAAHALALLAVQLRKVCSVLLDMGTPQGGRVWLCVHASVFGAAHNSSSTQQCQ
jgi:hypothetical protein